MKLHPGPHPYLGIYDNAQCPVEDGATAST